MLEMLQQHQCAAQEEVPEEVLQLEEPNYIEADWFNCTDPVKVDHARHTAVHSCALQQSQALRTHRPRPHC